MKNKIQILGIAILVIFAMWLLFALLGFVIEIVMTKIFLVTLIVTTFIIYRNNHDSIAKYILLVSLIYGIFVFDMIVNILFIVILIIMIQIIKKINLKQLGPVQITLIIFACIYLYTFGLAQTISKVLAVFAVISLFLMIIWKEIKIYFTPTQSNEADEINFIDQNIKHQNNTLNQFFTKFINMELMNKNIAINIAFTFYILLVVVQMLSELILAVFNI